MTFFNLGKHPVKNGSCKLHVRFSDQANETSVNRKLLRRSFGNDPIRLKDKNIYSHNRVNNDIKTTPFRIAFNAGDANGTNNKYPNSSLIYKGSNQINTSLGDGLNSISNGSYYTGNSKYIYDSSDYLKYRKLKAINQNYNDTTYGGDNNNSSQSALSRVR